MGQYKNVRNLSLDSEMEELLNSEIIHLPMRKKSQDGLENKTLFDEDKLSRFFQIAEEFTKNGWNQKIGKSDDCLTFSQFRDYVLNRFYDPQKYETHITECEVCDKVVQRLQNHIQQEQSQHPFDAMYRKAESLYYRLMDYRQMKRQPDSE